MSTYKKSLNVILATALSGNVLGVRIIAFSNFTATAHVPFKIILFTLAESENFN